MEPFRLLSRLYRLGLEGPLSMREFAARFFDPLCSRIGHFLRKRFEAFKGLVRVVRCRHSMGATVGGLAYFFRRRSPAFLIPSPVRLIPWPIPVRTLPRAFRTMSASSSSLRKIWMTPFEASSP